MAGLTRKNGYIISCYVLDKFSGRNVCKEPGGVSGGDWKRGRVGDEMVGGSQRRKAGPRQIDPESTEGVHLNR